MSRDHLVNQIKRIEVEVTDLTGPVSVIVQMKTPDKLESYLQTTADLIGMRRVVTSARALLPPPKKNTEADKQGHLKPASRRRLARGNPLVAGMFLATDIVPQAREQFEASGAKALQPLMQSDLVQGLAKTGGAKSHAVAPITFPLTGTAVLSIPRDQVGGLAAQLPNGTADVFLNREVRIPPVAKSTELPRVVEDLKGYTWGLAKTGALAAWGAFRTRGEGATVAVLDTGVDPSHPDLKGKIADFAEFDSSGNLVKAGVDVAVHACSLAARMA